MRPEEIVVVIPAHNEEDLIGSCLASMHRAADAVAVPVRVVVILDGCTDATAQEVCSGLAGARSAPRVRAIEVNLRDVGAARGYGFAVAGCGPRTWFATTDADSVVPPHWLAAQLEAAREYDLFVGTVEVVDWSGRAAGVRLCHESAYTARPGHRHIHGTSLGISATAYRAVGGFRARRVGEDVALVESCVAAGLSIAWSDAAPVVTSARRSLRTGGGFGARLTELELSLEAET